MELYGSSKTSHQAPYSPCEQHSSFPVREQAGRAFQHGKPRLPVGPPAPPFRLLRRRCFFRHQHFPLRPVPRLYINASQSGA